MVSRLLRVYGYSLAGPAPPAVEVGGHDSTSPPTYLPSGAPTTHCYVHITPPTSLWLLCWFTGFPAGEYELQIKRKYSWIWWDVIRDFSNATTREFVHGKILIHTFPGQEESQCVVQVTKHSCLSWRTTTWYADKCNNSFSSHCELNANSCSTVQSWLCLVKQHAWHIILGQYITSKRTTVHGLLIVGESYQRHPSERQLWCW